MSIALDIFCLTVAVTMPLAAKLYVFIVVGGWVKPSSWSVIIRGTAVCLLWNSPLTSASTAGATTCLRILYFVRVWTFAGGGNFGYFFRSVGNELR